MIKSRWSRWVTRLAVLAFAALTSVAVAATQPSAALAATVNGDDAKQEPLLLIHGFNDDCNAAWDTNSTRSGDRAARDYLGNVAGFATTDRVGYYTSNAVNTDSADTWACDTNLNQLYAAGDPDMSNCGALALSGPQSSFGTKDDRLDRLGCLLAWYIYKKYTHPSSGQPRAVNVLAHSMGGLMIRDAIARTSAHAAWFPPAPLRVLRVVTVATPHSGIDGSYLSFAQGDNTLNGAELDDMTPGSSFFNTLGTGKPQGAGGTYWALLGASDGAYGFPCVGTPSGAIISGGNIISCWASEEADGIVPAASQMAMPADYKALYGVRNGNHDVADVHTQYEHEVNIPCGSYPVIGKVCLTGPYYLNDANGAGTSAWVCGGGCNDTNQPATSSLTSVPHSLSLIAAKLKTPVITDGSNGNFATLWLARGGVSDSLPISFSYGASGGQRQDFMRSDGQLSMLWSTASGGTFETHGLIRSKYDAMGGQGGYGFPTTNESLASDSVGRYNDFTGGRSIYYTPAGNLVAIYGAIGAKWFGMGRERSLLSYPVLDETDAGNGGRVTYFSGQKCSTGGPFNSGSAIYYSPTGVTAEVHGCIYAKYQAIGGPVGSGLGFPTSDEYPITSGGQARSDFQCGYIVWNNGNAEVHQACNGTIYLPPTVQTLENNTSNCPGSQQYFSRNDYSGIPINWTYANGSYACVHVSWSPLDVQHSCNFDFYVPNGFATANVRFDILWLLNDDIPRWRTVYLNENPVSGWQSLFSGTDVVGVNVYDNNGQTNPTQIGWGSQVGHSLRQTC